MAGSHSKDKTEVKGCLLSGNICETLCWSTLLSLVLVQLEDDQCCHHQFHQLTVVDVHVGDLMVWVLPLSPANSAKEFTSPGEACHLLRKTVKRAVGWEGNGKKCPSGRFCSYLWARKRRCKFSNPDFHFPSHLCFYIMSYFSIPLFPYPQFFPLPTFSLVATTCHPYSCPTCQLVSQLPRSVPLPLKRSPVILLVSCSLPVACDYTFLCHTCPVLRLLPYLCFKQLLPSATLPALPWLLSALSCLVPISLILFHPFPVFVFSSSGSAILLCHLIFSFICLYCSQVVSLFLLPLAAWMPAEGAWIAQLWEHRCTRSRAWYPGTWTYHTINTDVRAIISCDLIYLQ